jgi:hypothetical protein
MVDRGMENLGDAPTTKHTYTDGTNAYVHTGYKATNFIHHGSSSSLHFE